VAEVSCSRALEEFPSYRTAANIIEWKFDSAKKPLTTGSRMRGRTTLDGPLEQAKMTL